MVVSVKITPSTIPSNTHGIALGDRVAELDAAGGETGGGGLKTNSGEDDGAGRRVGISQSLG